MTARAFRTLFLLALAATAAPASELTLELRSAAAPDGPAIRIVVEGRRYEPPVELAAAGAGGADSASASVAFLARLVLANASGDTERLVALFRPAEREATRATAAEPGLVERNAAAYRAFVASRLVAEIAYGPATFLVVEHDLDDGRRIVQLYPTVVEDGTWFLTNALKDDSHVETLRQAFAGRKDAEPAAASRNAGSGSTKP